MTKRARLLCLLIAGLICQGTMAASARTAFFISDLHVGAGKQADGQWRRIEDFRWQSDLDAFLIWADAQAKGQADLVLVGDVFELWQSPFMTCSSDVTKSGCVVPDCSENDTEVGCSEVEALARLSYTLKQHADFIGAIRAFAAHGDNRVYFIPGNHDAALLFDTVRQSLLDQLGSEHISVLASGFWLSADGRVYADHGHQFDDVNTFKEWPTPFVTKDGVKRLRKPWGENMVQQFYNQYEEVFPIIDNLSEESAGVKYAVNQAGLAASAAAVGKFFRFFLFQQSLSQAVIALGKDNEVKWDRPGVRSKPIDFFLQGLASNMPLAQKAGEAKADKTLVFDAHLLTDAEIDAVCAAHKAMPDVEPCPVQSEHLGAALKGLLLSQDALMAGYLRQALPTVQRTGQPLASVYVYGHTHLTETPSELTLMGMKGGPKTITYVNTGAFQRVATPEQIARILAGAQANGKKLNALDLAPENLPACYTFVLVPPYEDAPVPASMVWVQDQRGRWDASGGTCQHF